MSAFTAARMPRTADQKLLDEREKLRRWIAAAPGEHGPLWQLLHDFVEDALTCGLRHSAYGNRVKNGLRFRRFLQDTGIPESAAFDGWTALTYQRYLSELRKEERVQPAPTAWVGRRPSRRLV